MRPRVRRSKRKKTDLQCSFWYNNINGFKGKSISYQQILGKLDATIVVLCETKLANINKVKDAMPKYDIIAVSYTHLTLPTKA